MSTNKILAEARKFRLTWRKSRKAKPVTIEPVEDFKLSARDFNFITAAAREFRVLCVNYSAKPHRKHTVVHDEFGERLWQKYQQGIRDVYKNLDSERVNREFYEKFPEKKAKDEKLAKERKEAAALEKKRAKARLKTTVMKPIKPKKTKTTVKLKKAA